MSSVWIDGNLVPVAEARVSAFDHALLTGDGVFETLRIYAGVPFAIRRHLERLARSAAGMGLACPTADVLQRAMTVVVEANRLVEGRLRITLTGGPAPLGSERGSHGPTLIVAGGPMVPWPPTADVMVVPWPRNERGALAGIKSVSYGENVVALAYAAERGAGEAIFANLAGNLCEGTGSNVFVGIGGRLFTPPLSSGCLAGVTRDLVIEMNDVVEEDLPIEVLTGVDEAFLTSSTREIQPIATINGAPVAASPGPLTASSRRDLQELVVKDTNP